MIKKIKILWDDKKSDPKYVFIFMLVIWITFLIGMIGIHGNAKNVIKENKKLVAGMIIENTAANHGARKKEIERFKILQQHVTHHAIAINKIVNAINEHERSIHYGRDLKTRK